MQLNLLGQPDPAAPQNKADRSAETRSEILLPANFSSLDEAREFALNCTRCNLCNSRKNVAFSRGNPEAHLMLIGEGPGQFEDETGLPFVGKAGQLLDKILEAANLNKEKDVYICNVVKCRPPGNRVPEPIEVESCRPFLQAQIELIKPKLIMLAGSTAVQNVLKTKEAISRLRGKWFDHESGARVMPVFHPSYLLRNDSREVGSPKWLMWQDIKEVKRALDEIVSS